MFNWLRKKRKLPVPQEVKNAVKLYYEASEGSLQRLPYDEFREYIGAECQAYINDGEDRTEKTFYKMVNEVFQNQYNLNVRL